MRGGWGWGRSELPLNMNTNASFFKRGNWGSSILTETVSLHFTAEMGKACAGKKVRKRGLSVVSEEIFIWVGESLDIYAATQGLRTER